MKYGLMLVAVLLTACSEQGFELPSTYQQFQQPEAYNNKVDVLILSDNSTSMLQIQQDLAAKVPGMISALDQLGMDYQIGVVTTDIRPGGNGGRLVGNPGFVRAGQADLLATLQSRVVTGEGGSDLEQGLESIRSALLPENIREYAPGFLRKDSLLALIFLSNEDDYSAITSSQFIAMMNDIKPPFPSGARSWVANYIGLPSLSTNCNIRAGFKEVGIKYLDVVNYSGGAIESICSRDFTQAVKNVRVRISEILTDYHFDRVPNVATISVTRNGAKVPNDPVNGWTYIEEANVIRFHGDAIPAVRDSVQVDFTPAGAS